MLNKKEKQKYENDKALFLCMRVVDRAWLIVHMCAYIQLNAKLKIS